MFAFSRSEVVLGSRWKPMIFWVCCYRIKDFKYPNRRGLLLWRMQRKQNVLSTVYSGSSKQSGRSVHGFINSIQPLHQFKDTPSSEAHCCNGNAKLGRAKPSWARTLYGKGPLVAYYFHYYINYLRVSHQQCNGCQPVTAALVLCFFVTLISVLCECFHLPNLSDWQNFPIWY